MWNGFNWLGIVADSFKQGKEPSGSIVGGEFHQLSDCQLLEKNSTPWS
jgi:hypothetical protein